MGCREVHRPRGLIQPHRCVDGQGRIAQQARLGSGQLQTAHERVQHGRSGVGLEVGLETGQESAARAALSEATGRYESFGAAWDIRRAEGRLRPYGIRRGVRSLRTERGTVGWAALTPTEIKIAGLVAAGMSNPEIASQLFLSRNTVQSHVSHILAKLGAKGRVEIVREALRQGVSP